MDPLTAISIGSALVSAHGQYKSAQAQADARREQGQINFLKAEEILSRNFLNNELLMESALVHRGTQEAQIAGSGMAMGEATRGLLRDTIDKASSQIERNTRAAEWEARMIRLGAESQIESAGQIETAGKIQAFSTAGFGTASAYANAPKGKKKTT